jgi:hypothetical protein
MHSLLCHTLRNMASTPSSNEPNSSPPGPQPTSTNKVISTQYRCEVCDSPFPSQATLERHRQEGHKEVGQDRPATGEKTLR